MSLMMPIAVPICKLTYTLGRERKCVNVYPTLQFLYSKHIKADYITPEVKELVLKGCDSLKPGFSDFFDLVDKVESADQQVNGSANGNEETELHVKVFFNHIRQAPLYSIGAVREGVYIIAMKDQFSTFDLQCNPLAHKIEYVTDDMGFVLYDRSTVKSLDTFGPYFIEQYIVMEVLSKSEVAQNVIEYYVDHKAKLQCALDQYNEEQGRGFICWRFINDPIRKIGAGKHQGGGSAKAQPDCQFGGQAGRQNAAKFPGKMVRTSPRVD